MLLFFVGPKVSTFGQWHKVEYNELKGMQNPLVKSITKDSLGFVWAATDGGVIRFDGKEFLQINENIPSEYIKHIFTTSTGVTLASSDLGVFKINTTAYQPTVETILKGDVYASDSLLWYPKYIYESISKDIWIADNHSIVQLDSSLAVKKRYQFFEKDIPTNFQRSFSIIEDNILGLYVLSEAGYIYHLNKRTYEFEEVMLLSELDRVNHAFFDDGIIYVSTQSGFLALQLNKSGDEILSQKVLINEFAPSWVTPLSNNEWLASTWNKGLYLINSSTKKLTYTKVDLVDQKVISSVYVDPSGEVWLSTDNGMILLREQYFEAPFSDLTANYIQDIQEMDGQMVFSDGRKVYFCKDDQVESEIEVPSNYGIVLRIQKVKGKYWFSTNIGFLLVYNSQHKLVDIIDSSFEGGAIYSFLEFNDEIWYLQDHAGVYRLNKNKEPISYGREKGVESKINILRVIDGELYAGGNSDEGYLFRYKPRIDRFKNVSYPLLFDKNIDVGVNDIIVDKDQFVLATNFGIAKVVKDTLILIEPENLPVGEVKAITTDPNYNDVLWISNARGIVRLQNWTDYLIFDELAGLPSKTMSYRTLFIRKNGQIWAGTASGLGISDKQIKLKATPKPVFTYIGNAIFMFLGKENPEISSSSYIDFQFASLSYPGNLIQYQYRYNNGDWLDIGWNNKHIISGLDIGEYDLEVKAKQIGGYDWSEPSKFHFNVTEKWYKTVYGILGLISLLGGIGFVAFKLYDEKVQYDKEVLEQIVKERTKQIESQNKILSNRELILKKQVDRFKKVNDKLQYQRNITHERLQYAKSLQSVVLPSAEKLNTFFNDSFLIFKPKEVVSGDFYWVKSFDENVLYLVLSDCIGHGMPGAIQALIGMESLGQIIDSPRKRTNEILEELDDKLSEKSSEDPTLVGMDIMILRIEKFKENVNLCFAGAKRPLFYFENNEFHEVKGTRRAIGNEPNHVKQKGFIEHTFIMPYGTQLYLTSNGYYDQFNNEKKRIGIVKFRKLLEEVAIDQSMEGQRKWLQDYLVMWKSSAEQIDDITVLGVKI
ncbi:SpoIIE family protein phosphatase [Flammeovirga agarivorans]|uniref:SpoIIE family protein phosphatase n=1 Tax=Flammeovirga agarivorans TaxID=2726742 RepID=A0A7X8SGU4_9BACT|nr:SpoIIE family protein phosphatase [Flammeovirga agarivorans]NLR89996.1 SpoIIE family protein phosphatase [Flammeovirga agarivorans]